MDGTGLAQIYLVLFFLGLALTLAWIVVPFVLFSINARLRRLWLEQQRTNALLESMRRPRDASGRPGPNS